jgi:hypothetical protein
MRFVCHGAAFTRLSVKPSESADRHRVDGGPAQRQCCRPYTPTGPRLQQARNQPARAELGAPAIEIARSRFHDATIHGLLLATVRFGLLYLAAALVLGSTPGADDSGQTIATWFRGNEGNVRTSVWLLTLSAPLFAVFAALIRAELPSPYADVFFFGAIAAAAETAVYGLDVARNELARRQAATCHCAQHSRCRELLGPRPQAVRLQLPGRRNDRRRHLSDLPLYTCRHQSL